ncbi:uncharacterized protein MELLADRAFT_85803 [Melampsora larici-populina 98AG31]|uniref:ACB domain-containing protein n=1 Tax=Melampsora larici-populina (strain 98AG31 / pathotype 3-4-7) TaxID=747676 RepID=F4RJU2_MELLP|nr:uncharacterized protein MELLADRAFT_85803 [Melampsora larici-populina 98AG31]EGG07437.1 hypothetical protein MELLADRAFT_85803 [Melampsora larici-populina 98AG31]
MEYQSNSSETVQAFLRASAFISNHEVQSNISQLTTTDKLQFYSLFKIVTTFGGGPLRTPSFWDFEGKAKFEAWKSTKARLEGLIEDESRNSLVELAAREYIEKAREIGWDDISSKSTDPSITQDWKTGDSTQKGLTMELSRFLAEGGLNELQITNEEIDQDSDDESTPDISHQIEDENCSRDEYGFEIDSTYEPNTSDTEINQQGIKALSNLSHSEHNPPGLNMISVSKMLNAEEVNNKSSEGSPSLHDLIIENNEVGVREFIDDALQTNGKGPLECIINQFNTDGYTPLHLACDRGHMSIVQLLIQSGANPCLKDQQDDLTAQELAREAGMAEVDNYLDQFVAQP